MAAAGIESKFSSTIKIFFLKVNSSYVFALKQKNRMAQIRDEELSRKKSEFSFLEFFAIRSRFLRCCPVLGEIRICTK